MTDEEAMDDVGPYLNADCIALIFQYLNCYELVRVSTMCKLWNNVGSFTLSTKSQIANGKNSIPEEILINILKQNNGNLKSLNLYGKSCKYNDLTENIAKAIKDYCPNLRKLTACHNIRLTSLPTFFSNIPNLSDICFVVTMDDDVQQNIVFNVKMPFLKKLGIKRKQGHVVLETESSLLNFHGSLAMTPNLTHILLNGITLNTDFNRIGYSCPNLEVVKVSGCGYERGVACFLPSLKGLNLTELDLRLFDRNQFEYQYPTEDSRIDFVVDCLVDFKRLEVLKDQYGPRVFFLEFPFFAENMIIRSILNLWWHSEILKLILGVVRGMFTKRLKGTRRLLYTVKSDFFEMTALHSKC